LGEYIAKDLVKNGFGVTVLARSSSDVLEDIGVRMVRGDVLTGETLFDALEGAIAVFHVAGLVSRDPDDGQRMMRLHVDGTRRVVEAMAERGVSRMVLVSTSGTIAVSKDEEILDERAGYPMELVAGWPYYASKIYQEQLAFGLGPRLGVDVVAVNPGLLLGPGDRRLSSTGDVRRFLNRQIPVVPDGGINFVDARDAARATVVALDQGRAGERYLLGGPNWTMKESFGRLSRIAKSPAPWLRLPPRVNRWGAQVIEELYRRRGKLPPVDRISVEMSEHYWWFDSKKAETELGFSARDPALTLHDTVEYLRATIS